MCDTIPHSLSFVVRDANEHRALFARARRHRKFTKILKKDIDKQSEMWYNVYTKEREVLEMKVEVRYECWTYISDGRTVSAQEQFESAAAALARAKAWHDFGAKAQAYKVVVHLDTLEIYFIPLK